MRMEIGFPGGLEVEARYEGFTIPTDQPARAGGGGSAPAPFDLFLASIGTCAGLYALRFCQHRGLDTTGLAVTLSGERAEDPGPLSIIRLEIQAPAGFPDKYRDAMVRAVDQCTVKRHILRPPAFEVRVVDREPVSDPARADHPTAESGPIDAERVEREADSPDPVVEIRTGEPR